MEGNKSFIGDNKENNSTVNNHTTKHVSISNQPEHILEKKNSADKEFASSVLQTVFAKVGRKLYFEKNDF